MLILSVTLILIPNFPVKMCYDHTILKRMMGGSNKNTKINCILNTENNYDCSPDKQQETWWWSVSLAISGHQPYTTTQQHMSMVGWYSS
jgi:hypothetical protein